MPDLSRSGARRERAIEAARNATALLFYDRNAAAAVADAVLKVADDVEVERSIEELEAGSWGNKGVTPSWRR